MPIPRSEPVVPIQPKQDSYGFRELALFQTYTREGIRADYGVEIPAFDPTRVIKTWFDSTVDTSDPANIVIYKVIAQDAKGQWSVRQMVMPAREAATLNLPGVILYPSYVIAPTKAARGVNSGIWPETLSLRSEGLALLGELGLSNLQLFDEGEGSVFPVVYGDDEPRRQWFFVYKGEVHGVGGLLGIKNAKGIGYPGHWAVGETIDWVPDPEPPTGLKDARPPREVPVRDLLPNEKIAMTLMGPIIVRTDRMQAQAEASGQFTEMDRQTLKEIQRLVQQLAPKG
ncbi:MAG: hypothetical protein ABIR70_13555 [Bryobacteraceae bacterium]